VAARRYRSPGASQSLKVLLALTLRKQDGPIDLPGRRWMIGRRKKCPNDDGGRLVDNGDGTYYCPECGETFYEE
jgi:hypothetical protein